MFPILRTRRDLLALIPAGGNTAELGVFQGEYSREILEHHPRRHFMVDLFQGVCGSAGENGTSFVHVDLAQALDALRHEFRDNPAAEFVTGDSISWLQTQPSASMDWIYIDSSHQYESTVAELRESWRILKPGGWLCGHDYAPSTPGVIQAVDEFVRRHDAPIRLTTHATLPSFAIRKPGVELLVLTGYNDDAACWGAIGEFSWNLYAWSQGYYFRCVREFVPDSHPSWQKLSLIRNALSQYQTVWWSDADSVCTNPNLRLDEQCADIATPLAASRDWSADGYWSAGHLMARRSSETSAFFAEACRKEQWKNFPLWDQSAMHELTREPTWEKLFAILPRRQWNSVPSEIHAGSAEAWQEGDFLAHITAVPPEQRVEAMMRYAEIGYQGKLSRMDGFAFRLEFGGGLGDVFHQCYVENRYNLLDSIPSGRKAQVVIVSHCPAASELFALHPNADQIELVDAGYWAWEDDAKERLHRQIPPRPVMPHGTPGKIKWPATRSEKSLIHELVENNLTLVCALSAGLGDRTIPPEIGNEILRMAVEQGFLPILTGRSYDRWGREELYAGGAPGCVNLIDKLSTPGLAYLVQHAHAVVCCHSAVNLVAWHERKPQLLLYPESVWERHFRHRDDWSFGLDYPETFHGLFAPIAALRPLVHSFLLSARPIPESVKVDAPRREVNIDYSLPRLTPAGDVCALIALAAEMGGDVLEIGCSIGLTTRDLAVHLPGSTIFAVENYRDPLRAPQQMGERPPLDEVCRCARDLPNVKVHTDRLTALPLDALRGVRTIFIDGDHTPAGCQLETDFAFKILAHSGGMIVWHDYYHCSPSWVGVRSVADTMCAQRGLDLRVVRETAMAFTVLPPSHLSPAPVHTSACQAVGA